jgi:hypothetical protein
MTDKEKLTELLRSAIKGTDRSWNTVIPDCLVEAVAENLLAHGVRVQQSARPLEEWGEDYGDVLWWKFPIEEPPYVGSPLDANWPAYHTHWTPIVCPNRRKENDP